MVDKDTLRVSLIACREAFEREQSITARLRIRRAIKDLEKALQDESGDKS